MTQWRPRWSGFHYDGRTAHREPVTVTIEPNGLRLERTDGGAIHWPFDGVRRPHGRVADEPLRLEYGTDPVEALVVHEDGLVEAVRTIAPGAFSQLREGAKAAKIVARSLIGTGAVVASFIWGIPLVADWITPRVPVEWETRLGASVVERMAPERKRCADPAGMAALRVVFDRLTGAIPSSPYEFRLFVVRDSAVNAFAAPGGFVVVNEGLLVEAETPEELAGVLAHEIQHVVRRHSTRAVIREAPLKLAVSALAGGGMEAAGTVVATLGSLRFSRAAEAEADREGMRLLDAAEVNPLGIVAFLRGLESADHERPWLVSYLSSHPSTADRVASLEAMARNARVPSRPVLDSAAWRQVKAVCASDGSSPDPPGGDRGP